MAEQEPFVYDKAKYHYESVEEAGLPEEHASNHAVPMLRWLIERNLMSEFFLTEGREALDRYRSGDLSIHGLYGWWDTCLISDMLSKDGNAFAMHYFDYSRGRYIQDYKATMQGALPSEFHIVCSEDGYARLKAVIDKRYNEWRQGPVKPWWRFWK